MPSAGLGHVATASFLASRVAPTGGFAVALAGGVAIARAAQRGGFRSGAGTSAAAILQTVAIMGPARVGIPLTQAVSAPVLGWMEARGRGTVAQALAAAAIRLAHHVVGVLFYVWLILGIDAYAGSYDRLLGWLPLLPEGRTGALIATALAILGWTVGASVVQAVVYRRGLRRWPADGSPSPLSDVSLGAARAVPARAPAVAVAVAPRFDPRAVVLAAVVAFAVLVASTAWALLGAVAAWLAVAWALSRGDRAPVPAGLVLTAALAGTTLVFGLAGGLGVDVTLRRTVRAALLVLVATWLRSAAGEDGLREVFRRMLRRVRRVPVARETEEVLGALGSPGTLAASGRRLLERLRGVPAKRPVPLADAVLDWVAGEAGHHAAAPPEPPRVLRARARDGALVALAVATALSLPLAS
ncbi:MAG TPA: hypothetical protein VGW75_17930 [Solirubrobacteraceae bacterium]|jgi:hypothetical protein|nr:hypothetical protein [Solirubrobacteraceae bacterium]